MVMDEKFCTPPEMGDQYPEFRCFERTFCRDPEKQARAMRFLIGFYGLALFHRDTDPDKWEETISAIATLERVFEERYPDFMQENVAIDHDCGGGTYNPEDRLIFYIKQIKSEAHRLESDL